LEFVQLSDLFKASIFPFLRKTWYIPGIFAMASCGMFIMHQALKRNEDGERNEKKGQRPSKFFDFVGLYFFPFLFAISGFIIFLFFVLRHTVTISGLMLVSLAVTFFVGYLLFRLKVLRGYVREEFRLLVVLSFVFFPIIYFKVAKSKSYEIYTGL
jgi:hypothetical protein